MPRVTNLARAAVNDSEECERDRPEAITLYLPSSLTATERAMLPAVYRLVEKETRLRIAQLWDLLFQLRRLLRSRTSLYNQKKAIALGQRENTRASAVLTSFNDKIHRVADQYRAVRTALLTLDPDGDWKSQLLPLAQSDVQGPDASGDDPPEHNHKRRNPRARPSEGRRQFSWIWLTPGALAKRQQRTNNRDAPEIHESRDDAPAETHEDDVTHGDDADDADVEESIVDNSTPDPDVSVTLKVEWCKAFTRAERWTEEKELVREEMRRTLAYCDWKASWWREQMTRRTDTTSAIADGVRAYAVKQSTVWDGLALSFAKQWAPLHQKLKLPYDWPAKYASVLATSATATTDTQHADPPLPSTSTSTQLPLDSNVTEGGEDSVPALVRVDGQTDATEVDLDEIGLDRDGEDDDYDNE